MSITAQALYNHKMSNRWVLRGSGRPLQIRSSRLP